MMSAVKKRPFAFSCFVFILSSLVMFLCSAAVKIITAFVVLGITFFILLKRHRKGFFLFMILFPVFVACIVSYLYFDFYTGRLLSYAGGEYDSEFVVLDEKYSDNNYAVYTVNIRKINGKASNFKAYLKTNTPNAYKEYSLMSSRLLYNEYIYSGVGEENKLYTLSQGISLDVNSLGDGVVLQNEVKSIPSYWFDKINTHISGLFDKSLDENSAGFAKTLFLGNRNDVLSETEKSFRQLGLTHILAVSGMHLAVLVGSLEKIIPEDRLSRRKRALLFIFVTVVYAGVTGFSPSVKRAALMLVFSYVSNLFLEYNDSSTSLLGSVAMICILSPVSLFDVGLWLSFLSTYGIVCVSNVERHHTYKGDNKRKVFLSKLYHKLYGLLLFNIAPIIFSLPVIWLTFGEISVLSPIFNIVFNPIIILIMYICPVFIIFSGVEALGGGLAFVLCKLIDIVCDMANVLAGVSPVVSINYKFIAFIICLSVVVIFVFSVSGKTRKRHYLILFTGFIFVSLLSIGVYNALEKDEKSVIYAVSEYGEGLLIISQNRAILCDISGCYPNTVNMFEKYLDESHKTTLDGYVVTDYNSMGAQAVEKLSNELYLDTLYLPYAESYQESIVEKQILLTAEKHKINVVRFSNVREDTLEFDEIKVNVKTAFREQANLKSSVCVKISYEDKSLAYIGKNAFCTAVGKEYMTRLFNEVDSVIFGKYGREFSDYQINENSQYMILKYKSGIDVFFADEFIYNSVKHTISPKSSKIIVDTCHKFVLN